MRLWTVTRKAAGIIVWRLRHYGVRVTWIWSWTRVFMCLMGRDAWRFCQITPQLCVGGQMRAGGWRWMKAHGITACVNLREEHDDGVHGVSPDDCLWLPTPDDQAPTQSQLRSGVEFIRRAVEQGGQVYVHCAMGVGRAPTMAAAYLISTGMSPEQAITTIQRVRPFIKMTQSQLEALKQVAAESRPV